MKKTTSGICYGMDKFDIRLAKSPINHKMIGNRARVACCTEGCPRETTRGFDLCTLHRVKKAQSFAEMMLGKLEANE